MYGMDSYHINYTPAMYSVFFTWNLVTFAPSRNNLLLALYFTVQRRVLIYFVRTVVYCFHAWWGVHSQDLCCLGRISTIYIQTARVRLKSDRAQNNNSGEQCPELCGGCRNSSGAGALRDNYITSRVSPGSVSWSLSGLGGMCRLYSVQLGAQTCKRCSTMMGFF